MEKLKKIQEELDQLSQNRLELITAHHQKVEQQKTFYQRFFGQPPRQLDPVLECIDSEIARLEAREFEYFRMELNLTHIL